MKDSFILKALLCGAAAATAGAQTHLDLRTQTKSVDFSGATATKPFRSGPTLPTTCSVGEMFFLTTAVSGPNSFGCSAANSWTSQSGDTSGVRILSSGTPVG